MTKGGSGKPKTLGRLIFGEKRKPHASPARHRSSTRNGGSVVDLSSPPGGGGTAAAVAVATTKKSPINLHDWAAWRTQLNEQMGAGMTDRRPDLKHMRQFLHSNSFYQKHSRDPSGGRHTGVRLLFSIPHAKIKPEFLDEPPGVIIKNNNEVGDIAAYEQSNVRSNSDDRTTTSVNSVSAGQPMVADKTICQLLPKGLVGNIEGFLQTNEQMMAAADGMRTRRTTRSSYTASDRIHSTLQKAVKDGNVLEKIKAFEMQAAAAQAESTTKLVSSSNHRIQSAAHRTLSPVIVHPMTTMLMQQQSIRSNHGRYVHPVQQHHDGTQGPIVGHESRKGAHVLEPAHGDIILKRRTSSQKTANDEDYSITAISSMALTSSHGRHRSHHQRTSVSRSRHRQEIVHEKRAPSSHEHVSHKHQQKQKGTTTPSAKSSTRRRWLKGRKEIIIEVPTQGDKQAVPTSKSTKTNKNKNPKPEKAEPKKTLIPVKKGKLSLSSDNNRVYGVPTININEQPKLESPSLQSPPKIVEESESDAEENNIENTNTYMSPKEDDISQSKECDTVIPTTILRRPSKKNHQQRSSGPDGEILSKVDEDNRFSRPSNDHAYHSELDEDKSEGDVFIEELRIKTTGNITRHQSIHNIPNNESRRLQQQQQPSNTIRRHASQNSADDLTLNRRCQQSKKQIEKKQQPPITIITRKNKINQDEQNVYEAPQSEQIQVPVCNSHTLKKKRPFHTINAIGSSSNNEHNNNKQISKQILHAIMNSMNNNNNNQEQSTAAPAADEFFENGPLTYPEEPVDNTTDSA